LNIIEPKKHGKWKTLGNHGYSTIPNLAQLIPVASCGKEMALFKAVPPKSVCKQHGMARRTSTSTSNFWGQYRDIQGMISFHFLKKGV